MHNYYTHTHTAQWLFTEQSVNWMHPLENVVMLLLAVMLANVHFDSCLMWWNSNEQRQNHFCSVFENNNFCVVFAKMANKEKKKEEKKD